MRPNNTDSLAETGHVSTNQNEMNLVPLPAKMKIAPGHFAVRPNTSIVLSNDNQEMRNAVAVFNELLNRAAGFRLPITTSLTSSNVILCKITNATSSSDEGYKLCVQNDSITLEAKTPSGIFYGMQTLRQMLPPQIERQNSSSATWSLPCAEIEDEPRFVYRGLMLDVCRHFMPKRFIMKFIDMLAYHKMNILHWHLTDDQGWRIEIKKYPKLTQIGAFRNRTLNGHVSSDKRRWDNVRYGGYYTQDEMNEVIAYAKERFVTIVPEVEIPGHAVAALASYPSLSCTGGAFEVEGLWGIFDDVYCPKEETFEFLENVLSEVIDIFPSQYIHIGGDEVPILRWQECAHCQALIKKEGLKGERELQSYFIERIGRFVESRGRKIVGWDEILEGELPCSATVMSWRGEAGGVNAVKQGHNVIMTPNDCAYLDHYQADPKTQPLAFGGFLPLKKVYEYSPIPSCLNANEAKYILGVQGNIWTEYISDSEQVEYMALPRGAAIAEIGWSPESKRNYVDFRRRMLQQFKRYDGIGWNYCKAVEQGLDERGQF